MAAGAVAAGCGSDRTDVTQGIEDINRQIDRQGFKADLDCPDKVDGAEGTTFECTVKSDSGNVSEPVKMKIVKQGDDLAVTWADTTAFNKAVEKAGEPQ
jgi:hypothetical protein